VAVVTTTFRPMETADVPAVADLEAAAFTDPWSERTLAEEIALPGRRYLVAIGDDGVLAGYGGVMVVGEDAHLLTIAVDPRLRRRGLGSRLLVRLVDEALAAGARHLTLEVRVSNEAARALYRKFGFEPVGVRRRYYRDEDALIMWAVDVDGEAARRRLGRIREGVG
jgi:ribosomal-protein-alanine N-acetyltransferase